MLEQYIKIIDHKVKLSDIICIYEYTAGVDFTMHCGYYTVFVYRNGIYADFYAYDVHTFNSELLSVKNALAESGILFDCLQDFDLEFFSRTMFPERDKGKPFFTLKRLPLIEIKKFPLIKRIINKILYKEIYVINEKLLCFPSLSNCQICRGYPDMYDSD